MSLFRKVLLAPALFAVAVFCSSHALSATDSPGKLDELRRFSNIFDLVNRSYVREVKPAELVDGAVKGMLQSLDPHSTYLTATEYKDLQESTSGKFLGVGIEISMENNQLIVVSPIDDTPAYKAGLKPGDIILAVDGHPTQEMSMQEAVSRIRGPKGTEVELLIMHKDAKIPATVKVVRDTIPIVSVKARTLEPGYHWLRISRFSETTTRDLLEGIAEAKKRGGMKGVVLDLRNNSGGLLDQAVKVSEIFLRSGEIVSIRRREKVDVTYRATAGGTAVACPTVVLVNAGSASAAEIVAGALKDHKRALLIGEKTFGKGSVQDVIPMPGGNTALKMTIALYYTPSGRSIQAEGVEPDLLVPFEIPREGAARPSRVSPFREKDLSRHLEQPVKSGDSKAGAQPEAAIDKDAPEKDTKEPGVAHPEAQAFLERDNQLRLALQMVKALPSMRAIQAE